MKKKDEVNGKIINQVFVDKNFRNSLEIVVSNLVPLTNAMKACQEESHKIFNPLIELMSSYQESYTAMNVALKQIASTIEPIAIEPLKSAKVLQNIFFQIRYLNILEKHSWPMQLYNDKDFFNLITNTNTNIDDMILVFFTHKRLEEIKEKLNEYDILRTEIYQEAFEDYYHEKYFSCVALLLCQIDNLLINEELKQECEKKTKKDNNYNQLMSEINDAFKTNFDAKTNINDKKRLLIAVYDKVNFPELGFLQLVMEILKSPENKEKWCELPYRNKICHGDQLNFGSKKHALKMIFFVYGLNKIKYEFAMNRDGLV